MASRDKDHLKIMLPWKQKRQQKHEPKGGKHEKLYRNNPAAAAVAAGWMFLM